LIDLKNFYAEAAPERENALNAGRTDPVRY
jgi:hypothetical protein